MLKYQKRIRLKNFDYKGLYRYYVTINTNYKISYFNEKGLVELVKKVLKDMAEKFRFLIWVYCFMPNHLHFLAEGEKEDSDFRKFVTAFKQKSGYLYKKQIKKKLWQENYYEHVLRKDEDTMRVIKYILNNPVRAGLVENYYDYPYSGSFVKKDIKDLF